MATLLGLATLGPANQRDAIQSEALAAAKDQSDRLTLLRTMLERATDSLRPTIVHELLQAATGADDGDVLQTLECLAPHMDGSHANDALALAIQLEPKSQQRGVGFVAPLFHSSVHPDILNLGYKPGDWFSSGWVSGMAPYLPEECGRIAFEFSQDEGDTRWLDVLISVKAHLPARQFRQLLDTHFAGDVPKQLLDLMNPHRDVEQPAPSPTDLTAYWTLDEARERLDPIKALSPWKRGDPLQDWVKRSPPAAYPMLIENWSELDNLRLLEIVALVVADPGTDEQTRTTMLKAVPRLITPDQSHASIDAISPYLGKELLKSTIEAYTRIQDSERKHALIVPLIPNLASPQREREARRLADELVEMRRARYALPLFPYLDDAQREVVLEKTADKHMQYSLVEEILAAAAASAPLSGSVAEKLVSLLSKLHDRRRRGKALATLVSLVSEPARQRALSGVKALGVQYFSAEILELIREHVTPKTMRSMLKQASRQNRPENGLPAFRVLGPRLPDDLLDYALEIAYELRPPAVSAKALSFLLPRLKGAARVQASETILRLCQDVQDQFSLRTILEQSLPCFDAKHIEQTTDRLVSCSAKVIASLARFLDAPNARRCWDALQNKPRVSLLWLSACTELAAKLEEPQRRDAINEAIAAVDRANDRFGFELDLDQVLDLIPIAELPLDRFLQRALELESLRGLELLEPHVADAQRDALRQSAAALTSREGTPLDNSRPPRDVAAEIDERVSAAGEAPESARWQLWQQSVLELSSRTRADVLTAMAKLVPLVREFTDETGLRRLYEETVRAVELWE